MKTFTFLLCALLSISAKLMLAQTFYGSSFDLPPSSRELLDDRITIDYQVIEIDIDSIRNYIKTQPDTVSLTLSVDNNVWVLNLLRDELWGTGVTTELGNDGLYRGFVSGDTIPSGFYISSNLFYGSVITGSSNFVVRQINSYGHEFAVFEDIFILTESPYQAPEELEECEPYYIEVGLSIDNAFIEFQNGDIDAAYNAALYILFEIEEFWQKYFNIHFVVRGPFNMGDMYWNSFDAFSNSINVRWRYGLPCQSVDVLFHVTGISTGVAGEASRGYGPDELTGDYSCGYVKVRQEVPEDIGNFNRPHYVATAFHEFGHVMGAGHLDKLDPPGACGVACMDPNRPLMCSFGANDFDNIIVSICTKSVLKNYLMNACDVLDFPDVNTDCESCTEELNIITDAPEPLLIDCGNSDIVTVNAFFANDCDEESVLLEIWYRPEWVELVEFDGDLLELTYYSPGDHYLLSMKEYLTVGEEENIQITFKARVIGANAQDILQFRLYKNQPYLGTQASYESVNLQLADYAEISGSQDVSSLSIEGKNLLIDGTLNVDEDFNFDNVQILLKEDAEIVIESGVTSNIISSNLAACDEKWSSIELADGAVLNIDNSSIRDAEIGINLVGDGNLLVKSSELSNNTVGIKATPNPGSLRSIVVADGTSLSNGFTALELSDVSSFILGSDFSNRVVIDNFYRGVVCINSDGSVVNTTLENIHGFEPIWPFNLGTFNSLNSLLGRAIDVYTDGSNVFTMAGTGTRRNIVQDCDVGVYARGGYTVIEDVFIESCDVGLELAPALVNDLFWTRNYIQTTEQGIRLWPFSINGLISSNFIHVNGSNQVEGLEILNAWGNTVIEHNTFYVDGVSSGMRVLNSEGLLVAENQVYIDPASPSKSVGMSILGTRYANVNCDTLVSSSNQGVGLLISDSPGVVYRCNKLSDFENDIQFLGISTGTALNGQSLHDSEAGLLLGSDIIGSEAIIGPQNLAGNLWFGEYDWIGAHHYSSNPQVIQQSSFFVNSNEQNSTPPNIQDLVQLGWFVDLQSGIAFNCSSSPCMVSEMNPNVEVPLTNDTFSIYDDVKKYIWGRQLLEQYLSDRIDTVGSQDLAVHLDSLKGTNLATITEIEIELRESFRLDSSENTYRLEYISQRNAYLDSIQLLLTSIIKEQDVRQLQGYSNVNAYLEMLDSLSIINNNWLGNLKMKTENILEDLYNTNNSIQSSVAHENYEIDVTDIILRALLQDTFSITANDSVQLAQIASQCLYEGGFGVYRARSLYAMINPIVDFSDADICGLVASEQGLVSSARNEKVYMTPWISPNPVKSGDRLVVNSTSGVERIDVFDFVGRHVYTATISEHYPYLETSCLMGGAYLILLSDGTGDLHVRKLLVVE